MVVHDVMACTWLKSTVGFLHVLFNVLKVQFEPNHCQPNHKKLVGQTKPKLKIRNTSSIIANLPVGGWDFFDI